MARLLLLWLGAHAASGARETQSLEEAGGEHSKDGSGKKKSNKQHTAPVNPGDIVYFKGAPWETGSPRQLAVRFGDKGVVKSLHNTGHAQCWWNSEDKENAGAHVTFPKATLCVPFRLLSLTDQRMADSPSRPNAAHFAAVVGRDVFVIPGNRWGERHDHFRCQIAGPAFSYVDLECWWSKKNWVSVWCSLGPDRKLRNAEYGKDVDGTSQLKSNFPNTGLGDHVYYKGGRQRGEEDACTVTGGQKYEAQIGERFTVDKSSKKGKRFALVEGLAELADGVFVSCPSAMLSETEFFQDSKGTGLAIGDQVKWMGNGAYSEVVGIADETLRILANGILDVPRKERKMVVKHGNDPASAIKVTASPDDLLKV